MSKERANFCFDVLIGRVTRRESKDFIGKGMQFIGRGIAEDRSKRKKELGCPGPRSSLSGPEKAHETIVYHNICARLRVELCRVVTNEGTGRERGIEGDRGCVSLSKREEEARRAYTRRLMYDGDKEERGRF